MRRGSGLCVQLIHPLQPLISLRLSLSESLPRAGEGVGLGPQSSQPLPSSRLVAAPGPDSAGSTCGCGRDASPSSAFFLVRTNVLPSLT